MAMARMRTEVQKRATQESELQRRLQGLEAWAQSGFPKLDRELSELRGAVEMSVRQCTQLKDQLLQQVEEWKKGHGMVMEHSRLAFDSFRAWEEVRRCTSACGRAGRKLLEVFGAA